MDTTKVAQDIDWHRRRFFGAAALTVAATQLGMVASASTEQAASREPAIKQGTGAAFGTPKQIDAGVLNVGYVELGAKNGPAVLLLHGWPYDIHSFEEAAPLLASAGYRVIVPYLRGYGTTRFLSSEAIRNGQPSALAVDVVALLDSLKIEKAILAGFDWGARARRTSWRHSGRSGARPWFPSAAI